MLNIVSYIGNDIENMKLYVFLLIQDVFCGF